MFTNRAVLVMLAKKDFQTRYKRATFGVLWAVALPALQAAVLAIVFSKVIRPGDTGIAYGAYVMSGMLMNWLLTRDAREGHAHQALLGRPRF